MQDRNLARLQIDLDIDEVRGVGEVPIVPPPAALANAIYRAVGVRLRTLPMSPGRVTREILAAKK